jgi:hypothetical protein
VPVSETSEQPSAAAEHAEVGRGGAVVEWLRGTPELIPGVGGVAVFLAWTASDGGYVSTYSYPGALFLLGLLAATVYAYRDHLGGLPRGVPVAIGLLGAFTVWNFLSIGWADDQGAAWEGANRCLIYLVIFALFALPPWRRGAAAWLLGFYALAIAGIGGFDLLQAANSADPFEHFNAGLFAEPTEYHNANAAILTGAIFPAIFLASRPEAHWLARGAMLASAGVLFQLALLPQSRGWLVALPVAAIAYVVLVPGRVRTLIMLVPLGAVAALTADPMLDVFDASDDSVALGLALDRATDAILIAAASLFVAGIAIGLADRQITLSEQATRVGTRVVGALAAAGALAGAIVVIGVIGNPVSWADARWDDFKSGQSETPPEGSRLGNALGSNRYDFWRVAADEFTAAPIAGVGSDNFAQDYIRDRDTNEEPYYVHNLPLSVLSGTGLVGGLLFAGFFAVVLAGVGRVRLRSQEPFSRAIAGLVAVTFVYLFVHSVGDWHWTFTALWGPVLAWLAVGMRLDGERGPRPRSGGSARRMVAAVAMVVAGAVATVSFVLPWTAALDTRKAGEIWAVDPAAAFDRLDRARSLNFLSANADLVEGEIASRLDQPDRMRSAFNRALERDSRNWYATLELAALDALEGDRAASLERLERVAELNPRETLTDEVRRGLLKNRPVTLAELDDTFLERYCLIHGQELGPNGCESP